MSDTDLLLQSESADQGSFDHTWRPILAECVGVTFFVFVGCLAVNSGGELHGGSISVVALGHGLTIAVLIMGLGEISGGHFNPAVTLGVMLAGAIKPILAMGYFLGQIVGGVLGAALVRGVLPSANYQHISGGTHQLGPGVDAGGAILTEIMLTTLLVFTVLMAAVNEKTKTSIAPLAIGFSVAVDIMAGGPLTGASMNPARAFGPAVASSAVCADAWKYHYIYWVGPFLGSVVAFLLYKFFFASSNSRWISRNDNDMSLNVQMDNSHKTGAAINHM